MLDKAWQAPLAVVLITVPIIAATVFGGAPAGLGAAFLAAAALVTFAVRAKPSDPIEPPGAGVGRLLVIAGVAADGPAALGPVLDCIGNLAGPGEPEVLVVAPASSGRLANWTSDLRPGQVAAAERLVLTLAGLAAAGVDARSRVGDPDPTLAIEDAIRTWPAEKVLILSEAGDDRLAAAARDAMKRATIPVRHVELLPAHVV